MKKRKGFIMLWAIAAMAMAFLLGTAACFSLSTAMSREADMEIHLDETLLAQDCMERAKYNARFSVDEIPLQGTISRNGRTYEVHWQQVAREIEGIAMIETTCRVEHSSGRTIELVQLWEVR